MRKVLLPALALFALSALAATPASAIECDGNFQIQRSGNVIATPYCQDRYLTAVAREYGMRVSFDAIRYNLSVKEKACRLVGYDIRVADTCAQYLYDHDPRYFRR